MPVSFCQLGAQAVIYKWAEFNGSACAVHVARTYYVALFSWVQIFVESKYRPPSIMGRVYKICLSPGQLLLAPKCKNKRSRSSNITRRCYRPIVFSDAALKNGIVYIRICSKYISENQLAFQRAIAWPFSCWLLSNPAL